MKILDWNKMDASIAGGCVVVIGNFDGVHLGHQSLINQAIAYGKSVRLPVIVLTFSQHPRSLQEKLLYLSTTHEKDQILQTLGVNALVPLPFVDEVRLLTPNGFMQQILVEKCHAKAIFVGHNFRFGHNRSGSREDLIRFAKQESLHIQVHPLVQFHGMIVSSSLIRSSVAHGKVDLANQLLGYPYSILGQVVHGKKRGRLLGFPTMNAEHFDRTKLKPSPGVYVTACTLLGQTRESLTHIGPKPTFEEEEITCETWIEGWTEEVYDKPIRIHFLEKIREIKSFANAEGLIEQIKFDTEIAHHYFERNPEAIAQAMKMAALFD